MKGCGAMPFLTLTRFNASVNWCQLSDTFGSFSGLDWNRSHLYVTMNHIVVVAVPQRLQNLPHVVAGWTGKQTKGTSFRASANHQIVFNI